MEHEKKEKGRCPYCGDEYNLPSKYIKFDESAFVAMAYRCQSCSKEWMEYGFSNPISFGYIKQEEKSLSGEFSFVAEKYKDKLFYAMNTLNKDNL